MKAFRPHSFDTRGFFFGMRLLIAAAIMLSAVRYGTALASDIFANDEESPNVAAAAVAIVPPPPPLVAAPAESRLRISSDVPLPNVTARSFIVGDIETGDVYAAHNADTPYPIASISKLLVALAAREAIDPYERVTITKADRRETEGSPGSIQRDETFLAGDLLYPLLMESNNSVAYALERAGGGDEFVRKMLRIAHRVGMDETLLNDSSGLSPKNNASARDLFALARYIASHDPTLFQITRTQKKTVTAESGRVYPVANLNVFADDPSFLGGKTGYTDEAKETMIALFEMPAANGSTNVAIIVLGSDDRKRDVNALRKWLRDATR